MSDFYTIPTSIKAANVVINKWHRTHQAIQGGLFAVKIARTADKKVVGVAIVGRPCRKLDDGFTAEVTRVATDGTPNANSKLYGLCRRIAFILGYTKFTSLSLTTESGATFRAIGLENPKLTKGGSWSRPSRRRTDKCTTDPKLRWTEARASA